MFRKLSCLSKCLLFSSALCLACQPSDATEAGPVTKGMKESRLIEVMGEPEGTMHLGARAIYTWPTMKVKIVNGVVSEFEMREAVDEETKREIRRKQIEAAEARRLELKRRNQELHEARLLVIPSSEIPEIEQEYTDLNALAIDAAEKIGVDEFGICIISDYMIHGLGFAPKNEERKFSKFQIASCTKSINATLAAILVTDGRIDWESTLIEVFPELAASMHESFKSATLYQMLTHAGGMPGMNAFWASDEYRKINSLGNAPKMQRYELVRLLTRERPEYRPGQNRIYSNAGHYVAAAMLEKVTNKQWERMVSHLIFEPLGMKNTSPYGGANPQFTAPAGGVIATMEDFAKFCIFHMQYDATENLGISKENFYTVHGKSYASAWAAGFMSPRRLWAKGRILQHNGRDRGCSSTFWLAPEIGFGIFAVAPGGHPENPNWDIVLRLALQKMSISSHTR